ncbi:MAG: hypothetical protein ACE5HI_14445, partial [bacterium]
MQQCRNLHDLRIRMKLCGNAPAYLGDLLDVVRPDAVTKDICFSGTGRFYYFFKVVDYCAHKWILSN